MGGLAIWHVGQMPTGPVCSQKGRSGWEIFFQYLDGRGKVVGQEGWGCKLDKENPAHRLTSNAEEREGKREDGGTVRY